MITFNRLRPEGFTGKMLLALSGPLLWGLHFGFVYGIQTIACGSFGKRHDLWIDLAVILLTILALLALLLLIGKPEKLPSVKGESRVLSEANLFLQEITSWLAMLSFFGIAWTAACLLFLPACLSLA